MNILVIGNGFDLAHGLPTSYKDFVKFCDLFIQFYEKDGKLEWTVEKYHKFLVDLFEKGRKEQETRKVVLELYDLLERNSWFEYFHDENIRDNWTDFESEIAKVIQALDRVRKEIVVNVEAGGSIWTTPDDYNLDILKPAIVDLPKRIGLEDIKEYKNRLLNDLNKLTRALEIYLSLFINSCEVKKEIDIINAINADFVLSFNYTNTFNRVYGLKSAKAGKKVEYDFIHGTANLKHTVETCNMVVGIDEYLEDIDMDMDNEFIQFKKFYQRIYKQTGCTFENWIGKRDTNDASKFPTKVYVFGHSLDVTDKDVLEALINNKHTKTYIFHHDKEALGKQIANLVKVIGEKELIKRTGGKTKTIEFKEITKRK